MDLVTELLKLLASPSPAPARVAELLLRIADEPEARVQAARHATLAKEISYYVQARSNRALRRAYDTLVRAWAADAPGSNSASDEEIVKVLGTKVVAPPGYALHAKSGVWRGSGRGSQRLTDYLIAVVAVADLVGADNPDPHVTVRWRVPGAKAPQETTIPRALLARPRDLAPHLVSAGCPLPSDLASPVASYLVRQLAEHEVRGLLERRRVAARAGWVDGTFLWGSSLLSPPSSTETVDLLPAVADRLLPLRASGDPDAWRAAVQRVADRPLVAVGLLASLASVLSRLVSVPPAVLHYYGPTSTGKTTVVRVAASVWGDPQQLPLSWDATHVGLEGAAAAYDDLPVYLDELSLGAQERIVRAIYQHTQGHGRSRGRRDGSAARIRRWHGWLLSSGEQPLAARTRGGATARVYDLDCGQRGGVFGSATESRYVLDVCSENYGHLGPAFVRLLLSHPDLIKSIRGRYAQLRDEYADSVVSTSGVAARRVLTYALLELTRQLVHESGLLRMPARISPETTDDVHISKSADVARAALEGLVRLLELHPDRWWSGDPEQRVPSAGWLGVDYRDDSDVYLLSRALPDVCLAAGLPPGSEHVVRRQWLVRGWVVRPATSGITWRIRLHGSQVRALRIPRSILEEAAADDA